MSDKVGKIVSIAVRNFLTYDELKFMPGDNLNLIIGPNGTGKSSIVAAIILGCGGKPSIMGRSKNISDYVKNGKTKAIIEIELMKNEKGETTTLNRNFDKGGNEMFRIDGEKMSAKAFLDLVKREYNVHVDNLCMFLPQDRVQDFTKLNPQEILYSTQTSVCSQEIIETFESLKQKRESQMNVFKNSNNVQTQLDDHINRNNQLHSMIQNSKLKDQMTNDCEIFKKKLAWVEHDQVKVKYDDVIRDITTLKESVENKKKLLQPLEKRQSEVAGAKKEIQESFTKATKLVTAFTSEIDQLFDSSYKFESDIGDMNQKFRNIVATSKIHEKEIKELELSLSLDKREHAESMHSQGNYQDKIQEFDKEMQNNRRNIEGIVRKKEKTDRALDETVVPEINNFKRKIESINDTKRQRFNVLRAKYEGAYQACQWLEANRNRFRGQIFNPVVTEITIKDRKYAKYVENVISDRDLETFLCTDKEDMRELIIIFRNELKLQTNVAFTEQSARVNYQSDYSIDGNLKNLGIYAYVIDVIEGPAPVLNYLCALYRIHNVAIGNDKTYQCASNVPDTIRLFFSTNHRFSVNVSSYSHKKTTSSTEIHSRNILNVGIDQAKMDEYQNQLTELTEHKARLMEHQLTLRNNIEEIERVQSGIRNQKNAITSKLKNVKALETKIKKKEMEITSLKDNKFDLNEERQKIKDEVDRIVKRIVANNAKIQSSFGGYKTSYVKRVVSNKKMQTLDQSTGNVDDQINSLKREMSRVMDTLRNASGTSERYLADMNRKRDEALSLTDNQAPSHPMFKYTSDFQNIPDDRHLIEDKILEMQGRIDCIHGVDRQVQVEYEERKTLIEELQHQQKSEHELSLKLEKELTVLHNKWYPEIQRVVCIVNANFSSFFAKMGFVGEVELTRKGERDYDDYGIQIRVQYRDNEKLHALSRYVQSGGERTVAIAIYTLSLQHLATVPFRVVDEINQGMDPKNERKIFQMLVDITCRPGESQYFFITPKLLPDLPYHPLMTVNIVHNGVHIDDSYVFLNDEEEQD